MHPQSIATLPATTIGTRPLDLTARRGDAAALAAALQASRHDTLRHTDRLLQALPGLQVPQQPTLNPPLWELGHIGWFQEFWLARNPQRLLGMRADPLAPRHAPLRPGADAFYDSSAVAHALGIAVDDARWQAPALPDPPAPLAFAPGPWTLGSDSTGGFAFDNELAAHPVPLGATEIDAQVLRWADYLPFVAAGGYADARLWTSAGNAWRQASAAAAPQGLRLQDGTWQQHRHGQWQPLQPAEPARHLTAFEAEAWCAWAGRRLPTEAEWERAALSQPEAFRWGDVWEWTASDFAPYPGFTPHPYRDYSAPWFDGRPVLRGGSFMTQPRMKHPRYRNFFPAHRADVPAGFRSCAR